MDVRQGLCASIQASLNFKSSMESIPCIYRHPDWACDVRPRMKTLSEKTCDHRNVRQRICAGIKQGIGRSDKFRMVFGSAPDMRQRQMERPQQIDLGRRAGSPSMAHDGPNMAQKLLQDGSKMVPRGPKMTPRWPAIINICCRGLKPGPKKPQDG